MEFRVCTLAGSLDGREWPPRDWTLVQCAQGTSLGIVRPDVYALNLGVDLTRGMLPKWP
jgi:hypothetical protein